MNRRDFIVTSSLATAAIGLSGSEALAEVQKAKNKLPQWRGFNVLDFFLPNPNPSLGSTTEEYFKWMSDWGFNFIRVPIAYPHYLTFDRTRNITPEEVYHINDEAIERIDK